MFILVSITNDWLIKTDSHKSSKNTNELIPNEHLAMMPNILDLMERGFERLGRFIAKYPLVVIILWIIIPYISLLIFLIVASHHFGKEDTQFLIIKNSYFNQLLFFLKGSLIIFAPIYFHFDETILIFKLLLIDSEAFYEFLNLIETNKILLYGVILSTLSSIFLFTKNFEFKKFTIFLDYFSILIINYYFSPLVAFTIYFCFLHSVRHSITLMNELDNNNLGNGLKIFIRKAMPLTILTASFCLIGLFLLNNTYNFDSSIFKVIFIGLASLTFPHILLEYLLEKNEK